MSSSLDRDLVEAVERALGLSSGAIVAAVPVAGGCIHQGRRIDLDNGDRLFVKVDRRRLTGAFGCEAAGLEVLDQAARSLAALRVARPLAVGTTGAGIEFLVLEWIESGPRNASFSRNLGRDLALLHRTTGSAAFGFEHDNFIGATKQPNACSDDWVDFFRQHRLGFQLDLLRQAGRLPSDIDRRAAALLDRLEHWLAVPEESPCLLHGDLWGGNVMAGPSGEPVLIDPACYYGRREADLAMTYLFGGFDREFYTSYEETWPLAPGAADRLEIYKLYHLLNHANLFGSSYLAACSEILRRFT